MVCTSTPESKTHLPQQVSTCFTPIICDTTDSTISPRRFLAAFEERASPGSVRILPG
jgi:hypothetical protein